MGDIGELAPSNAEYKNISSIELLKKTLDMISKAGYRIVNIDLTYVGAEPRLENFKKDIEADIGVDELKKDVFNELKMEEFEKNKEPDND